MPYRTYGGEGDVAVVETVKVAPAFLHVKISEIFLVKDLWTPSPPGVKNVKILKKSLQPFLTTLIFFQNIYIFGFFKTVAGGPLIFKKNCSEFSDF